MTSAYLEYDVNNTLVWKVCMLTKLLMSGYKFMTLTGQLGMHLNEFKQFSQFQIC